MRAGILYTNLPRWKESQFWMLTTTHPTITNKFQPQEKVSLSHSRWNLPSIWPSHFQFCSSQLPQTQEAIEQTKILEKKENYLTRLKNTDSRKNHHDRFRGTFSQFIITIFHTLKETAKTPTDLWITLTLYYLLIFSTIFDPNDSS